MQRMPYVFSSYGRRQWRMVLVYGALTALIGLTELLGWWELVRVQTTVFIKPLLTAATQVIQLVEYPVVMGAKSYKAARRIQDLEIKYSFALAQVSELQSLRAENETLRKMIENTDRSSQEVIVTAPITSLSRPAVSLSENSGVDAGDLVIIAGSLVGRVNEVVGRIAVVDLLTQPDLFPLVVVTPRGVEGIIHGDGQRLIMTEVPADAELAVGEHVVTAGQPGVPPGIFVGVVGQIQEEPASPVKRVVINQLVSFYQSRLVEIYQ